MHDPEQCKTDDHRKKSGENQPRFAETFNQMPDHAALDDHPNQSEESQYITDLFGLKRNAVPSEASLGEQSEAGHEQRECEGKRAKLQEQPRDCGIPENAPGPA